MYVLSCDVMLFLSSLNFLESFEALRHERIGDLPVFSNR